MTSKSSTIGLFSSVLFAAACASGGATATSEVRPEAPLGNAASEDLIPRRVCTSSNTSVAPSNGLLADFSAKQESGNGPTSGGIPGKVISLLPPNSAPASTLTRTANAGKLTINVNAIPGTKPQFLITRLLFDGCIDASGFTGVQFNVSGSLFGCSLTYESVDPEHQYYRAGGPYAPHKRISPADLTSDPRTITASFLNPEHPGNPATPTDPSKLAFIQWLVIVPVAPDDGSPAQPCTGSIVIDDVKLYR